MSGDDILRLPVRNKQKDPGPFLVARPSEKCRHLHSRFEIDENAGKCKCLRCGEEVSAMFVLVELMKQENLWMRARERYQDELTRLSQRSRTKCWHCGKMTRISGR